MASRIAFCMTGGLNVEPGRAGAFSHEAQASAYSRMLQELREVGINSSIFVVVDQLSYHPHPGRITSPWRESVSGRNPYATHELRGCGELPFCKRLWKGNSSWHCHVPTINASSPTYLPWEQVVANASERWGGIADRVELQSYVEPAHCCVRNCSCSSSYTHFWEQVAKHKSCFDLVERHETTTGLRFDFVVKIRPDIRPEILRVLPSAVRMRIDQRSTRTVWLHSNSEPPLGFHPGFAGTDHLALVPRTQAGVYFRFSSEVDCEWIERMNRQNKVPNDMFRNEYILAQWLLSGGATLRRLYWPWQAHSNWTAERCPGANCVGPSPPPAPPRHPPVARGHQHRHG